MLQYLVLKVVGRLYVSRSNNQIYRLYSIIEITPFFLFMFSISLHFIYKINHLFRKRKSKIINTVKYSKMFFYGIIIIASFLINFCLFITVISQISGKMIIAILLFFCFQFYFSFFQAFFFSKNYIQNTKNLFIFQIRRIRS